MTTQNNSNVFSRNGYRWTVNEVLSLQREFELLSWDIDKIAQKHNRTPNAIMYKLDQEGFADYNVLYSNYHNLNEKIPLSSSEQLLKGSNEYNLNDDDDDEDEDDDNEDDDEDYVNDEDDNDDDDDDEYDDVDDYNVFSKRLTTIETGIIHIKNMLNQLLNSFVSKNDQSATGYGYNLN